MSDVCWQPTAERALDTNLARFARAFCPTAVSAAGVDYRALHRASTADPGAFWSAVWDELGVVGDRGTDRVVEPGATLRQTRFFPDAELNVAETLLHHGIDHADDIAMIFRAEDRVARTMTWGELRDLVSRLQQALLDVGVEPGDRVAVWMPNLPETYAVMLATASIGAVFSSTSPDFGVQGVLDRFGQIEPTILFAAGSYAYGGTVHDCLDRLGEIVDRLPTLQRVVIVPHLDELTEPTAADHRAITNAVPLGEFLAPFQPGEPEFRRQPFDHPLYILYSSGTTGAPKCIVHRAGGVLLKHLTEHVLHSDVRPGDHVFYFTTAGWMMWNWLASGLAAGATLVLYDGSPFHPTGNVLFDLADEVGVTLFGTSAKFIESLGKAGLSPRRTHDLVSVRTMASTGSPLVSEGFDYVYEHVSTDIHLASISGGTDLCGCLVAGDPTGQVHRGEIQVPTLGLDIDVVDDEGRSCPPGERGELVCRSAFPSMPLGFWDDPDDQRYDAAYFDRFPGLWHQGDFAAWTDHGGMIIHGRSDATLNPGGVRIGTAEIYRQVDQLEQVLESLVIGQEWEADTRVVLFVRLRDDVELTDDLVADIKRRIRQGATPRHVPARVVAVRDIPRTRSGKMVELAVREVVHGRPVKNLEALANPEALDFFKDRPELSS